MKKIIIFLLFFILNYPSYSQDCFDKIEKQAVIIDSLRKAVKVEKENNRLNINNFQKITTNCRDSIRLLKSELKALERFKSEKIIIDNELNQKTDSIKSLAKLIVENDRQISLINQKCEERSLLEKEKGRNEAIQDITNNYRNKSFDTLIQFSTKFSVQRDIHLVGKNDSVKAILLDLLIYFDKKELFTKKYNVSLIENAQKTLTQLKRTSSLLEQLKVDTKSYKKYTESLLQTISKLDDLDKRKSALDDPEIEKKKFKDIIAILADYLYNYTDYGKYPYLSDIVLDVIQRKAEDSDKDLSDLLKKLQ